MRGSGQPLADPSDRPAEDRVALPSTPDDVSAHCTEPVAGHDERPGLRAVFDLPRPLAHRVRARDAEHDFRMDAQVHHPCRIVDDAAAPAFGTGRVAVLYRYAN